MKLEEDRPEEAVPVYRREGGPGTQPSTSSTICMGFLLCDFNAKTVSYIGSTRLGLDASHQGYRARTCKAFGAFISLCESSVKKTEVSP